MISEATRSQIDDLIKKHRVVLFMKGSRSFPQCGFSATVTTILNGYGPKYETVNVLASPDIRDGIKEYSSWPTIPQLYIDGKFVGGCDIVKEMHATGELAKVLGVDGSAAGGTSQTPKTEPPRVVMTDEARAAIVIAQKDAGGDPLRITIGPRHDYDLFFDAKQAGDVVVSASGLEILFDAESASRAGELSISMVEGQGFRVESSKALPRVKVIGASDLKKLLDTDKKHVVLLDVRPEGERSIAAIPGHEPLDPAAMDKLDALADDVRVVVYCHHGHRSRAAAEQLIARGVKNVFNLDGGIEAYASVDTTIPRY
jgi:monothiol glutaredoxin